jgi:N-hydroxyarylamine O-acetyltransferase
LSLDLDAYFARIGYQGPRTPDLQTLTRIHELHAQTITFENLDPFLGKPVSLDLGDITCKLVRSRRGGYCFEQNYLMCEVLVALGFNVTRLSARVCFGLPPDAPTMALSHRFTVVSLPEGEYIADVGFGSKCPTTPIALKEGVETVGVHNSYRAAPCGDGLEIQFLTKDGWRGMYRFNREPRYPSDYEVSNWFTSTNPGSKFVRNLIVTMVDASKRYNLLNNELTTWHEPGLPETRHLETPSELEAVLTGVMKLDLPVPIAAIWEKLPQT